MTTDNPTPTVGVKGVTMSMALENIVNLRNVILLDENGKKWSLSTEAWEKYMTILGPVMLHEDIANLTKSVDLLNARMKTLIDISDRKNAYENMQQMETSLTAEKKDDSKVTSSTSKTS